MPFRFGGDAVHVYLTINKVDQWVEKHVTFSDSRPKLSKPTGSSQSAYRHGRQDGARQAIGLKETGKVADWALEK